MALEDDIKRLALQEERLQFEHFNAATAWDIGSRLKALVESRGAKAAIDIRMADHELFFYAMPGTTPANVDWVRRKRNVVMRFHKSSYGVAGDMKKNGWNLETRYGSDASEYVLAGGAFPIRLRGSGVVGTVAVSGLPERDDHGVIIEVLAAFLDQDIVELALPKE